MSDSQHEPAPGRDPQDHQDYRLLFHSLNNQLGVILAHAEMLELQAPDDASRARATQIVASTLKAMTTSREIRRLTDPSAT